MVFLFMDLYNLMEMHIIIVLFDFEMHARIFLLHIIYILCIIVIYLFHAFFSSSIYVILLLLDSSYFMQLAYL